MTYFDDFDADIQPEEIPESWEDIMDDNPIDADFEPFGEPYDGYDEGSDRDNWEDQQVFMDGQDDW